MHLTLLAAQSLDGFITQHDKAGTAFTSPEDKAYFSAVLRTFDCTIMGGNTYRLSRPTILARLRQGRLHAVLTRKPENSGADVVPGQLEFFQVSPVELAAELTRRGYSRCALLGGAQIYSLFIDAGLVDEVWITLEPQLFGRGQPLLARATLQRLKLKSTEALSPDTLLLKYEVARPS